SPIPASALHASLFVDQESMSRNQRFILLTLSSILAMTFAVRGGQQIGETPGVRVHMNEEDIESGRISFRQIVAQGEMLFTAVFNRLDGQGRPGTTADAEPRVANQPAMTRVSGPESHSCVSCHNRPRVGGGGDFATNVFIFPESKTATTVSV